MITKEELRSIPGLHKSIQRDKEQLRFLHEKATSLPSQLTGTEKVQSSHDNNAGKYIDAAVDLEKEIREKELQLLDLQKEAAEFMNTIDAVLTRKVIRYRYMNCYNWDEIATLLGYEVRWLQHLEYEATYKLDL